jgi:hypothetical protein
VIAVAAIGLTPIFPTIDVVPVVDIPAFDRITKLPAERRFTASSPDFALASLTTGGLSTDAGPASVALPLEHAAAVSSDDTASNVEMDDLEYLLDVCTCVSPY